MTHFAFVNKGQNQYDDTWNLTLIDNCKMCHFECHGLILLELFLEQGRPTQFGLWATVSKPQFLSSFLGHNLGHCLSKTNGKMVEIIP
jgi:hypothetical protein